MRQSLWRFLLVLFLAIGFDRSASAQLNEFWVIQKATLYVPTSYWVGNPRFEQSPVIGRSLASINYANNGQYTSTITFYYNVILARLTTTLGPDPTDNQLAGAVVIMMMHELAHECLGSTPDCAKDNPTSCHELAIESATHADGCQAVQDALVAASAAAAAGQIEAEMSLNELADGMCAELQRLEDKWNNGGGASSANSCSSGQSPCPFVPNAACPSFQVPTPPVGGFTGNNDVIPHCESCS